MSNESIFLEADNGGIAIYEGAGNRVDWAKDVLALSVVIENWNLLDRDNVFFTSSMDFASENGLLFTQKMMNHISDKLVPMGLLKYGDVVTVLKYPWIMQILLAQVSQLT